MNVQVHIERILLEGDSFSSFRPDTLQTALELHLQQQLAGGELQFPQGAHLQALSAPPLAANSLSTQSTFATQLATSIAASLRGS